MAVLTEADAQARALAAVQAYCGWHIAPSTDDELTLDGPGSSTLVLPSLHVTAISSVTELGTVVDPTGYAWSATGVVRRTGEGGDGLWGYTWTHARWTGALRGLVVAFTHGYDELPLEVQAVVDRVASRAVESSGLLTQVGQVTYATGEDGLPATGTLTAADRAVLDLYRLPKRP